MSKSIDQLNAETSARLFAEERIRNGQTPQPAPLTVGAVLAHQDTRPTPVYIATPADLDKLVKIDRLATILIRYRGKSDGRFTCQAQYGHELISWIDATDHYVRDIEIIT